MCTPIQLPDQQLENKIKPKEHDDFLVDNAEIEDWETEKDEIRQMSAINAMAQALEIITQSSSQEKVKKMVENSKNSWKKESDTAIDLYIQVTQLFSLIKSQKTEVNEFSIKVFAKKIQGELERIESYVYLDLASNLMEFKDIKYVLKCLTFSTTRLQKFLNFLKEFENECIIPQKQFNPQFEMMMNLEFKMQSIEPQIIEYQKQIRDIQSYFETIKEGTKKLGKESKKIFMQSEIWQSSGFISDQIIELNHKLREQDKIIKKMRRSLYGEGLLDYCGEQNFTKKSLHIFEESIKDWLQVPQNIQAQFVKIEQFISIINNQIEELQKELQIHISISKSNKKQSFFSKILGGSGSKSQGSVPQKA